MHGQAFLLILETNTCECVVIWFTIPEYFPVHVKGSVGIFDGPHLFGQFCLVSSVCMSKGCQVVSVPFFEVSG